MKFKHVIYIIAFVLFSCNNNSDTGKSDNIQQDSSVLNVDINITDSVIPKEDEQSLITPTTFELPDSLWNYKSKTDELVEELTRKQKYTYHYTFSDEYGEKHTIAQHSISDNDPRFYISQNVPCENEDLINCGESFFYDKLGKLCRLDILHIRKGHWRDEITRRIYYNNGIPYLIKQTRFFKNKQVFDTSYVGEPFEGDRIMYWDVNYLKKHVFNREPDDL
ncbi:MAG: hypothetical protein AB7O73_00815 [Bacteroidia bacterium]